MPRPTKKQKDEGGEDGSLLGDELGAWKPQIPCVMVSWNSGQVTNIPYSLSSKIY